MANKALGIEFTAKDNVSGTVQQIERELDSLGDKEKDLAKISERFTKITNSTMPVKRQLRELQMIMANMNLKGLTNTDVFTEIATKAGEMKDAIADAADAVNRYASDTMNLQATTQVFTGIAAAGSVAAGAIGLMGSESEDLQKVLVKVQAAQAMLNGVMAISNILNKDSALMLKIKQIRQAANVATTTKDTVATAANTAATTANTAATVANTAATKAWNYTKAISKALFGDFTGLLILGAAGLITYSLAVDNSTDSLKDQAKEVKNAKSANETYVNSLAQTYSNLMGTYSKLKAEWNQLSNAHEKNVWIKNNTSQLKELGAKVKKVSDVEDFFAKNTSTIVEGFRRRAQAAAYAAAMTEAYRKQIELEEQAQEVLNKYSVQAYDKVKENPSGGFYRDKGSDTYNQGRYKINQKGEFYYTQKGAEAYNQELFKSNQQLKEMSAQYDVINQKVKTYEEKYGQLASQVKPLELTTSDSGNTEKKFVGGLNKMKEKLNDLQSELSNGLIPNDKLEATKQKIQKLTKEIEKEEVRLGIRVEGTEGSASKLKAELNDLTRDLSLGLISDDKIEAAKAKVKQLQEDIEKEEIRIGIKPDPVENAKKNLQEKLNSMDFSVKISSFDKAVGNNPIDIPPVNVKMDVSDIDQNLGSIQRLMDFNDNLISQLQDMRKEYEKLGDAGKDGIKDIDDKVQDLTNSQDELTKKAKEYLKAQENLNEQTAKQEKFNNAMSLSADTLGSVGDAMSSLGQAFEDDGMKAAGIIATAIANILAGYAAASAQAASLGPWGWVAFVAAGLAQVAAVIAQIHSLSGFAEGGIVMGNSRHGDHLLARVNAGEMILNDRQQKNLFDAIDNNRLGGGSELVVGDIKVKGSDLYIALKNYTKINKKKI